MFVAGLPIPPDLASLIDRGRWPQNEKEETAQNLKPIIPAARIQEFETNSPGLHLYSPPFVPIRWRVESGEAFWLDPMAAPFEIDHNLAIIIADFGIGFDAPIILDYKNHRTEPVVKYLKWSRVNKLDNHWTTMFDSFSAFAAAIGL